MKVQQNPSLLRAVIRAVRQLAVGQMLRVPRKDTLKIGWRGGYSPLDRVMIGVMASAYHTLAQQEGNGDITFMRIEELPDSKILTWVSPDRRTHYQQQPDGYYHEV